VIEYVGEVIDAEELEKRMDSYQADRHFYFLTLTGSECIDASKKGNLARFINHSCSPNCMTQKWYYRFACLDDGLSILQLAIGKLMVKLELVFLR